MPPAGPNIGIGVILFRSREDRCILLGKREGSLGHGTFSLSGGHLEHGETFSDCAKREVLEETGLEIESVQFFTAVENFFHGEGDGKRHYVTIFVTAFVKGGAAVEAKNMEPEKCEGWQWWTTSQLRERYLNEPETLFLPIQNLFEQRPEMVERMERGGI